MGGSGHLSLLGERARRTVYRRRRDGSNALAAFEAKWGEKLPSVVRAWRDAWEYVIPLPGRCWQEAVSALGFAQCVVDPGVKRRFWD